MGTQAEFDQMIKSGELIESTKELERKNAALAARLERIEAQSAQRHARR